jgi:hypothetical protein
VSLPQHYLIAALGRRLGQPPSNSGPVDWTAVLALAQRNRVAALIQSDLSAADGIPPSAQQELLKLSQRSFVETALSAQSLGQVASALAGIRWILLRGPALGARLYGDLMLRPFGDLDVLIRPTDVERALAALGAAGFKQPADSLPLAFYRRYHLHVELSQPGATARARLELHWALDHPFALITPDVNGLVTRGQPQYIGRFETAVPDPDDLVLSLAVHLAKHAVLLPLWLEIGQMDRIVDEGHLLLAFDLALACQQLRGELNWNMIAARAAQWGATGVTRDCLNALETLWPGAGLGSERGRFEAVALGRWQRRLYAWSAPHDEAFKLRRGMFFRPIRMLDSLKYLWPPAEYLQRRYGQSSWRTRARHWLTALAQLASGTLVLSYYWLTRRWSRSA